MRPGGQPALMKNPGDDNAVSVRFVKDDVLALLESAEPRENQITGPARPGESASIWKQLASSSM